MKTTILFLSLLLSTLTKAQTFDEWFRQNKTQLKYLGQQIAALEAYTQTTENGYNDTQQASTTIASIKQGDLDLHTGYFTAQRIVKPAIAQLAATITDLQQRITSIAQTIKGKSAIGDEFFRGLQNAVSADMGWLHMLTTNGLIGLTDDQRLKAIEILSQRMRQRLQDAITARNTIIEIQLNTGL
jgi:hypothetical protein